MSSALITRVILIERPRHDYTSRTYTTSCVYARILRYYYDVCIHPWPDTRQPTVSTSSQQQQ